jgi:hypothetical protein
MRMEHQAVAIRAVLARLGERGRGKRYPKALQERAVSYYCARRAQGAAQREIGDELGMPWQTLQRWATAGDAPLVPATSAGFQPVEVIDAPTPAQRGPIVVRGPAGLRIEGLDLDTLAELLRRLS